MRLTAYQLHCAALDDARTGEDEGLDADVVRARKLRKVEVGLAAMDAMERGLYTVVAADGPTPPLLPGYERIITGSGGHVGGQRANVIVVMPLARYPSIAAVKDYEGALLREQRRARIAAFNQRPIEERRALRAKYLDRENVPHDELMRVYDAMPIGTAWDEGSAMISEPRQH